MKKEINLSWFYDYPPETIWKYITDPDLLAKWSTIHKSTPFRPEVGFEWTVQQKPRRGWDGIMYLEVLEVEPHKKLAYALRGGPRPGEINLDTIVTYTLIPKDGGTELRLAHTGFKGLSGAFTAFIMEKGWGKFFNQRLKNFLNQTVYDSAKT